MSDISASERRLSAALDRIDQILEVGLGQRVPTGNDAPEAGLKADLEAANAQITALASANEGLIAANRALMKDGGEGDAAMQALEAEVAALRAARAAEIAQLDTIMSQLEAHIGLSTLRGEPEPREPKADSADDLKAADLKNEDI